jgi:Zn-finger nucleic acid-binding protein
MEGSRLAYLTCPKCRITLFDRNPLAGPDRCPRCARGGLDIELERIAQVKGRAAASVLDERTPLKRPSSEES